MAHPSERKRPSQLATKIQELSHTEALRYLKRLQRVRAQYPSYELTADELQARQVSLMRNYVDYARHNSVYWRDMLGSIRIRTPEDISALPFTTKKDLLEYHVKPLLQQIESGIPNAQIKSPMMTVPLTGCEIWRTSGSTGVPTVMVRLPEEMDSQDIIAGQLKQRWFNESDRVANMLGPGGGWSGFFFCRSSLNYAGVTTEALGNNYPDDYIVNELRRFRFNAIIAVPPTPYADFLSRLEQTGQINQLPPVEKYVFAGEAATALVRTPSGNKNLQDYLKDKWDTKIFSLYSGTEIGLVGFPLCEETRTTNSFHTVDDTGYIEFITPKDMASAIGEEGQVCVTRFDNVAVPLFRYKSGDGIILQSATCGCKDGGRIFAFDTASRLDMPIQIGTHQLTRARESIRTIGQLYNVNVQLVVETKQWTLRIEDAMAAEQQTKMANLLREMLYNLTSDVEAKRLLGEITIAVDRRPLERTSNGKSKLIVIRASEPI